MKTISQAEQALAELAEAFTDWRQHRAGRHERIPAPLWDRAVALSWVLPNGRVANVLKCAGSAEIGILPHRNELVARGLAGQLEGNVKYLAPLPS